MVGIHIEAGDREIGRSGEDDLRLCALVQNDHLVMRITAKLAALDLPEEEVGSGKPFWVSLRDSDRILEREGKTVGLGWMQKLA